MCNTWQALLPSIAMCQEFIALPRDLACHVILRSKSHTPPLSSLFTSMSTRRFPAAVLNVRYHLEVQAFLVPLLCRMGNQSIRGSRCDAHLVV